MQAIIVPRDTLDDVRAVLAAALCVTLPTDNAFIVHNMRTAHDLIAAMLRTGEDVAQQQGRAA